MPNDPRQTAVDPASLPPRRSSGYPEPFRAAVEARIKRALGDPFGPPSSGQPRGAPPGCWSSQRHWHSHEDEFVYVVSGELVLVTDAGEQLMRPGMVAGFPAGRADGHHLINRSAAPWPSTSRSARASRRTRRSIPTSTWRSAAAPRATCLCTRTASRTELIGQCAGTAARGGRARAAQAPSSSSLLASCSARALNALSTSLPRGPPFPSHNVRCRALWRPKRSEKLGFSPQHRRVGERAERGFKLRFRVSSWQPGSRRRTL